MSSIKLEREQLPSLNPKLNSSMVLVPNTNQVELKNLHPQGLYLGGNKQRKQKGANQFYSSASQNAGDDFQSQSQLNTSQDSDLNLRIESYQKQGAEALQKSSSTRGADPSSSNLVAFANSSSMLV